MPSYCEERHNEPLKTGYFKSKKNVGWSCNVEEACEVGESLMFELHRTQKNCSELHRKVAQLTQKSVANCSKKSPIPRQNLTNSHQKIANLDPQKVLRRAKKSPQKLKLSRISSSWPQTRANPRNRPIPAPTPQKVENRAKSSPRTAKQAPGSLLAASWRPPPPGPFDPPNSRIRTQIWPRRAPAGAWLDPRADPPNLPIPARRAPPSLARARKF